MKKYPCCCGIDVHQKLLVACIRCEDKSETKEFGATTAEIKTMMGWIQENQCEMTVMESTGSYWIPVWNVFEEAGVPIMLANAQQVKAVPGKKTDKKDAEWLAQLLSEGHIQASFVPDRRHRDLRALIVQRSKIIAMRSAETNRSQKILQTANNKLGAYVADIYGPSARVLLKETLENGTPSPDRIRKLQEQKKVSRNLKSSPEELSQALECVMTDEVRFMLKSIDEHIEFLDKEITKFTATIKTTFSDQERAAVQFLMSIPGVAEDSANVIIAVIGDDMNRFATSDKLCSWAGVAPGNNESAGKRKSSRTTQGHALLKKTLVVCAHSAVRKKNSFLGARYRRIVVRLGAKKAIMAIAHSILRAIWWMLTTGELYQDLGEDYYIRKDKLRRARASMNKLRSLGIDVKSIEKQIEVMDATDKQESAVQIT